MVYRRFTGTRLSAIGALARETGIGRPGGRDGVYWRGRAHGPAILRVAVALAAARAAWRTPARVVAIAARGKAVARIAGIRRKLVSRGVSRRRGRAYRSGLALSAARRGGGT